MESTVMHVVDRLTGGVPIAVRTYIENSDPAFGHIIVAPFVNGQPSAAWHGIGAQKVDLGPRLLSPARLSVLARRFRPRVIHAHSSFPGVSSRLAMTGGVPVIYSPHCFKFDDPGASSLLKSAVFAAERVLAKRTSCFAVLSEHEATLARCLDETARTERIPNAASATPRVGRDVSEAPAHIGMVGRIAPQKDPALFADIAEMASLRRPDLRSTWIGSGVESDVQPLLARNIRVSGWLDGDALEAALDDLGVYVHTARYEGFPLSVLDAASRGVPVIARRIPSLSEAGLQTFETPEEAVELILRALDDLPFRRHLVEAGDKMTQIMNTDSQRRALRAAWSSQPRNQTYAGTTNLEG